MSLKIIDLEENFIRFEISDVSPAEANALRRTILSDVPKLAIEKVMIHHGQIRDKDENVFGSSLPLFDEMVAQRLSMIPLKTDLKMNFRDQCSCEGKGCPLCTVTYSVNKLGPGTVMSSDLQPLSNPAAIPVDPEIPIVKLSEKQAMLVTADAVMGRGYEHSKWQVATGISYKYHREFVLPKDSEKDWKALKEKYPRSLVSEDSSTITFTDDFGNREITTLGDVEGVVVKEDKNRFIFKYETDGSVDALAVLDYSLKRIPQRLNTMLDSLVTVD
ncbi:MAG: DNA-directed RNA polymerase subunit D [Candidatus Thermoplasmatota archaeon]|jgi:DNA-directed RNA polymerase subunit D|nr:DNA-directed RNA polymerase subunit D [Candidatus Thermoplasmatota archaeon]